MEHLNWALTFILHETLLCFISRLEDTSKVEGGEGRAQSNHSPSASIVASL